MLVKRLLEIRWTIRWVTFNFWMTWVMVLAGVSYPVASLPVTDVSARTSAASEKRIVLKSQRFSWKFTLHLSLLSRCRLQFVSLTRFRLILSLDLNDRYRFSGDFTPVTNVVVIVTPHPLEARPLNAGDGIDFDADPSVSAVTRWAGAAMGSTRCVTAIDAGVARGAIARGRRRCHYGITGITARMTSELPIFGGFSIAPVFHTRRAHRRAGPENYAKAQRVVRARASGIRVLKVIDLRSTSRILRILDPLRIKTVQ